MFYLSDIITLTLQGKEERENYAAAEEPFVIIFFFFFSFFGFLVGPLFCVCLFAFFFAPLC